MICGRNTYHSRSGRVVVNRRMTFAEWCLLIGLSVLWGGSFLFTGIALEELPALTIVLLRVALAAAGLSIIAAFMELDMPRDYGSLGRYLAMGFFNAALPFSLIAAAQAHLASSVVSTLNATAPFITLVLAHCFTDSEKVTSLNLAGVLAGLLGVATIMGVGWPGGAVANLSAHLWCLLAAASYACAGVIGLRLQRNKAAPITNAAGQFIAATILLLPVVIVVDNPLKLAVPTPLAWCAIAGLAMLSTALGYVIYFRLLRTVGVTNLLLVTFLIPVSATIFGVAFLREGLGFREVAGFSIIAFGLLMIDGRLFNGGGCTNKVV